MKARLALALALLVATSVPAFALGLGEIELNSALNQRLDATIHLVSVSRNELDSLQVGLAPVDAFKRYKIERTAALSGLTFNVVSDGKGGAYVRVTSKDPIRDPFLTFLVEADWSNGRLLRQYTVLLDPPTFAENKPEPAQAAAPVSSQPQEKRRTQPESEIRTTGTVVSTPSESEAPPAQHAMPQSTQPGTYGRIKRGETLWGIARKLHQQSGASVNQMMVALYQANKDAFMGNMNRMKEGSILRVPKQDAINRISRSEATQFVKNADQAWRGGRSGSSAAGTSAKSGGATTGGGEKLTLVAPGGEEQASGSAAQGAGTGNVSKDDLLKLQNQLADTKAQLADANSNNSELQAKVDDLQSEVDRVRKMLSVKDDQLLALQQQVQQAGMQPTVKPEQTQAGETAQPTEESTTQTPPAEGDTAAGEPQAAAGGEEQPESQQPAATEAGKAGEEAGAGQAAEEASQSAEQPQPAEQSQDQGQSQPESTPPVQSTPTRQEPGLIESALNFLLQPLVLIGLLVVVVLIGGLVFISRRQHSKAPTGVRGSQWVIAEEDETPSTESEGAGGEEATVAATESAGESAADAGEDGHVDTLVGGKPVNLDEDDPLSEADFHMAYGLYDQAAEGLKQAIQREPDRADLQLKLLEVYFTAGNTEAFVNAAGDAKGVLGEGSEDWGKAVIMGKQIAPDDPMFADVGTASGVDLDFSSEDVGLESSGAAPAEPEPAAETEFDVSMDFDTDVGTESETTAAEPAESQAASQEETLEFDIGDFGSDTGVGVGSQVGGSSASGDEDFDKALEELSAYVDTNLGEADSRLGDESEDLSIEGPGGASEPTAEPAGETVAATGGDDNADEIATKLDLARAYIDMGDTDGARSILEEVMEDGGESHKQEAQSLLDQLQG